MAVLADADCSPVLDLWSVGAAAEIVAKGEEIVDVALEPNISGGHKKASRFDLALLKKLKHY
jgi:hypothetical protein